MNRRLIQAFLVAFLLLPQARAADPPAPRTEVTLVRHCRLDYRYATNLGVSVSGVIQDCFVDLGDRVKAGQVLARIDYLEQEANVGVAEAKFNLATTRLQTAAPLYGTHALSKDELDVLKGDVASALKTLEAAKAARQVRDIIAPHDGVVVDIFHKRGEGVNYGNDPVFRVVNWEVLRVTGFLDVVDAWRVHPGQVVRVTPEFAGPDMAIKHEVFPGKVVFVDWEIDPKNGTCRVIAEVSNRGGLLRSGLEGRMEIEADPAEAPRTASMGSGSSPEPGLRPGPHPMLP